MKSVEAGRKATNVSRAKCAMATGLTIGNALTVAVTGPKLGAAQMEQEWCDVWELTGCEWIACTVPIPSTRTAQSTHTTLATRLRFVATRTMPSL
jgi:hypothetical protein